jgi:dihydrofolate reductase
MDYDIKKFFFKKFSIIVACCSNGGIGFENKIPWYLPDDLKNFKKITTTVSDNKKTNAIVMGKNTWESLPIKPLPNRLNIVLTSNPDYEINDKSVIIANSFDDVFMYCSTSTVENIFIIGGTQIYNECFKLYKDYIDKIYLTVIIDKYYQCDRFIDLDNILLNYNINENDVVINNNFISLIATNKSTGKNKRKNKDETTKMLNVNTIKSN